MTIRVDTFRFYQINITTNYQNRLGLSIIFYPQFALTIILKYKSVIEEERRRYMSKNFLSDFEYFAGDMFRVIRERDPIYLIPDTLDKYVSEK